LSIPWWSCATSAARAPPSDDERRDGADAPLQGADERQRQGDHGSGAGDERGARLELVHPDVLAQHGGA
jgi:hypothetical protein